LWMNEWVTLRIQCPLLNFGVLIGHFWDDMKKLLYIIFRNTLSASNLPYMKTTPIFHLLA